MTYNPNIPTDLPPPNVAVDFIRTNFSQYQTIFSKNHTAINNSNQGKHEAIIYENQANDPGVTNDYDAVYSKSVVSSSGTSSQLFLQIPQFLPNSVPNLPQQLTFNTVNKAGPQFQSFLPGGYTVHFGQVSSVPVTITLTPTTGGIASVIVNPNNFTTAGTPIPFDAFAIVLGPSSFSINSSLATGIYTFTWIAICVQ